MMLQDGILEKLVTYNHANQKHIWRSRYFSCLTYGAMLNIFQCYCKTFFWLSSFGARTRNFIVQYCRVNGFVILDNLQL